MQETEYINVYGARVHNLKDIDAEIPRNSLTVITGLSGSGKSSLAFDTIFAEGQRRYIETFSAYARNFLGNLERPDLHPYFHGGVLPCGHDGRYFRGVLYAVRYHDGGCRGHFGHQCLHPFSGIVRPAAEALH